MRPFRLYRAHDSSGVSGTGYVAEGLVTTYGKVVLQWYGPNAGIGLFDTVEDMLAIHGHQGDTYMEFLTAEIVTPAQIRRY